MEQGILALMCLPETWRAYYEEKTEQGFWSAAEQEEWRTFLDGKEFLLLAERVKHRGYCFSVPMKKFINKSGNGKKRVVYSFSDGENRYLKVLTGLLFRYDDRFCDNCYSFRRGHGSRQAIRRLVRTRGIETMYGCKLDISNYFNSIRPERLLPMLKEILVKEPDLYLFFEEMLSAGCATEGGELIYEDRGAMAGIPVSSFFANVYLREVDFFFWQQDILYARYSDDILFFASTRERREELLEQLIEMISELGLSVNEEKTERYEPGDAWQFLGICYRNRKVDLSEITKKKLKGKIRRKARALYRWKCKKGATTEQVIKVMNRVFRKKLFDNPRHDEMTWSRWFFPLLTTDEGLREIDSYMQEHLRFLESGSFRKKNYKISYEKLKALGYQSLVHEFYKGREEK